MKLALLSAFLGCASAFVVQLTTINLRPSLQLLKVAALDSPLASGSSSPTASSPEDLVAGFLNGLSNADNVNHQMKILLHSSTHKWRSKIYDAVGAPAVANEDKVAASLGTAMRKADNQFAILLGMAEDFEFTFPSDTVDHGDGTCWVECRLYAKKDGELLVVSGWGLQQNPIDETWLFDRIDWQDFRDAFYPGLGREEWCRAFV